MTVMDWHLIGALIVAVFMWIARSWQLSNERFRRKREQWERDRIAEGWTRSRFGITRGMLIPPAPPRPPAPPARTQGAEK